MKTFSTSVKEGRFHLQARVILIGNDLLASIWGGTHPHIGAVARALPRPSLKDKKKTVVTAGIHWDNLKTEEIKVIMGLTEKLTQKIIDKVNQLL